MSGDLQAPEAALVIFAKAPIPGQVKTRLCPPLTPDEAATLHGSFVLDVLECSGRAAYPKGSRKGLLTLDRFLACAPSSDHVFFKIMEERHGVHLIDQVGEDLGSRMSQAFQVVFDMGYRKALIIGTDLPTLPESALRQAQDLLTDHDLVLGPSLDGGYYLIGLTKPAPDLFTGIPWSTGHVCEATRTKADAMGLKTALLPTCRDVDTIEDLMAVIREAGFGAPHEAPDTRRAAKEPPNFQARTSNRAGQAPSPEPRSPLLSKRTAGALRLLASRHRKEFGD
jgi:rSAM/selenodomain-associated transferase 1